MKYHFLVKELQGYCPIDDMKIEIWYRSRVHRDTPIIIIIILIIKPRFSQTVQCSYVKQKCIKYSNTFASFFKAVKGSFVHISNGGKKAHVCASEVVGIQPTPLAQEEHGMPAFAN